MAKSSAVPCELLPAAPDGMSADEGSCVMMPELERRHVQRVYDAIANQWHGTRYKAWPNVVKFVEALPTGSLVADLGCGNGKLSPSFRANRHFGIGCDFSSELVRISRAQMDLEAQVADVMALPYRSGTFDAAVSIAVLHHVATVPRRRQLIQEALRILRPTGRALFYAWAMEQSNGRSGHEFDAQDVFVPWHQKKTEQLRQDPSAPENAHAADGSYMPEKAAFIYQRYCHVYREGELADLVSSIPCAKLLSTYYDVGNWCAVVEKVE
uniref:Methyltransferase type 11 domain-containing protein n=1 Tax=Calcidiscus leptoporus TaxID=127549 RepID=A0A7S0JBK4_9EUKA|mmetsp:Transcript_49286/g.113919  ORF Transcript_49286/g.113919 Transcript_49286/m.113919 type:complete len:268 (+) Transcript_49286:23-826(+)